MEENNNMQNQGMPESPQMEHTPQEMSAEAPEQKGSGLGPWIGVAVVIIILLVGGLYFWGAQLNRQASEPPLDDLAPLELETTTNDSTDPVDIEADLNEFDVNAFEAELDADLKALDAELGNI